LAENGHSRARFYILDGHEPVGLYEPDAVIKWGRWFETAPERQVAFTDLGWATVSTVFLGVDHRMRAFGHDGPPILFETMVFANPKPGEAFPDELDGRMNRYCTWDEAKAGHEAMVAAVRADFWSRKANGK
jgi:hypothetical protein